MTQHIDTETEPIFPDTAINTASQSLSKVGSLPPIQAPQPLQPPPPDLDTPTGPIKNREVLRGPVGPPPLEPIKPPESRSISPADVAALTAKPKPIELPKQDAISATRVTHKPKAKEKLIDLETKSNDFITRSDEFLVDLQDPETPDAIKTAQLNELLTAFGPKAQALTDSMILTLKQQGKNGTGAGNSMLFNMARANNADFSNMKARLNTESAQRIFDANKFGIEKGLEMRRLVNDETREKFRTDGLLFSTAIESGNFEEATRLASQLGIKDFDSTKLETMSDIELANFVSGSLVDLGFKPEAVEQFSKITGIELDANDIAVLDEATQAIIKSRMDAVELITDPEEKQAAMIQLAQEYPEAFGFPGDPVGAAEMVANFDFSNVEGNANAQRDVDEFWQSEAIKDAPNINGIITAGQRFFEQYTDASIDSQYNNAATKFANLSPEGQVEALNGMEQFGVTSIDDIDTRDEKEAFLSLNKFNNKRKNVSAISEELFTNLGQTVAGTDLESWFDGTDPTKETIAKEWIVDIIIGGNYTTDKNGNIIPILEDVLPPWKENANQYTFKTWPRKYDENGTLLAEDAQYSGGEFRDDLELDSIQNDPASIQEDNELTRKYMQYKKETPDGLSWLEWYDETKGGAVEISGTFDPVESQEETIQNTVDLFNVALETGDFSTLSHAQQVRIFQADPGALDRLIASGKVSEFGGGGLTKSKYKRITDFRKDNPDLKFDETRIVVNFDDPTSIGGEGPGNGSIVIYDGRPYRLVKFAGHLQDKSGLFARGKERSGEISAVPLDVVGAEPEIIGGSGGFIDT